MASLAASRIGISVPRDAVAGIEAAALGMAKAHVDGPEMLAWRGQIFGRFKIDLPMPAATDWVFEPAAEPAAWLAGSHDTDEVNGHRGHVASVCDVGSRGGQAA